MNKKDMLMSMSIITQYSERMIQHLRKKQSLLLSTLSITKEELQEIIHGIVTMHTSKPWIKYVDSMIIFAQHLVACLPEALLLPDNTVLSTITNTTQTIVNNSEDSLPPRMIMSETSERGKIHIIHIYSFFSHHVLIIVSLLF